MSDALQSEAQQFTERIGAILRKVRTQQKLSLEDLAEITSVSKLTLGKIERGETNPTIGIMWKIANGLNLPLTALLADEAPVMISRAGTGLAFESADSNWRVEPIFNNSQTVGLEMFRGYLKPHSHYVPEPHPFGSVETVTVMSGAVQLLIQDRLHDLNAYDAIQFQADEPHEYRNDSDTLAVLYLTIKYHS